MPLRIHAALEAWRRAERILAETPPDAPGRHEAEEAVAVARDEYLAIVGQVALEVGSSGMADLTETQLTRLQREASER